MKLKAPPTPLILEPEPDASAPSPPVEIAETPAYRARPRSQPADRLPAPARFAYPFAVLLSVGWAAAATAFAAYYRSDAWRFDFTPTQSALLAAVVLLPVILIGLGAYSIRQSGELILETRRARAATDALVAPAVLAAAEAGDVVASVRLEITRAADMATAAMTQLATLRAALAEDSARMQEITATASAAAGAMTETLSRERQEMGALSEQMDARATAIGETIARQTEMVAQASDLAQTQLREAEASLAARAAELAAAASDAAEISSLAGQQLSLNADQLHRVGDTVNQQIGALQTNLSHERAQFEALEATLRDAQAAVVERLAKERALIIEAVAQGRVGSEDISTTATEVAGQLRTLIGDATVQLGALATTARTEQAQLDAEARTHLKTLADLSGQTRAQIEAEGRATIGQLASLAQETREASRAAFEEATASALARIQSARETLEQLGEMAFTSGQRADEIFDSRFAAARRLIDESTQLISEAGHQTRQRIEASLAAAQAAAAEITQLLDAVDERARQVALLAPPPGPARSTAADTVLEAQVSQTVASLSETARLMSDAAHGDARPPVEMATPLAPRREVDLIQTPVAHVRPSAANEPIHVPAAEEDDEDGGPPLSFDIPAPDASVGRVGGTRPRLRLTMTDQDRDVKTVFEPVRTRRDAADARTWRDILKKMGDEAENGDEALPNRLRSEVEALGVDPAALLPRGRIDEISRSLGDGDLDAGRDTVRRLAPAAVRRLARRMESDDELKEDARRFVGRFGSLVVEALAQDQAAASGLLGSDQGRVFLLLDASVSPAA